MAGLGADGGVLEGWAHVRQSIRTILTTRLGSRTMRRDFGSDLPSLVGAPMNQRNVMAVFSAAAIALQPRQVGGRWYGEPRFRLTEVEVVEMSPLGRLSLICRGTYYPNGHKGDYARAETVATDIALGRL